MSRVGLGLRGGKAGRGQALRCHALAFDLSQAVAHGRVDAFALVGRHQAVPVPIPGADFEGGAAQLALDVGNRLGRGEIGSGDVRAAWGTVSSSVAKAGWAAVRTPEATVSRTAVREIAVKRIIGHLLFEWFRCLAWQGDD